MKMGATFVQGTRVPITWVKCGPCVVTQVKTDEKDGYFAVQLGFSEKRIKNISKAVQGHLQKALPNFPTSLKLRGASKTQKSQNSDKAPRFLREVRLEKAADLKVGDIVNLTDIFKKGDVIQVTGTSKGKGFAGVVKRWKFAGGPKTHGQSDRHRAPGSIGQGTTPGRVLKGKHMAGRMGNDRVTIKNLIVVDLDREKNLLAISGALPGANGGLLIIKKLASGSLEELVDEAPKVVEQVEEPEAEGKEGGSDGKTESQSAQKESEGSEKATV